MTIKNSHCLTLRIPPELDDLVIEASYDRRTSKAAWIRGAIRQRLGQDQRQDQRQEPKGQEHGTAEHWRTAR